MRKSLLGKIIHLSFFAPGRYGGSRIRIASSEILARWTALDGQY